MFVRYLSYSIECKSLCDIDLYTTDIIHKAGSHVFQRTGRTVASFYHQYHCAVVPGSPLEIVYFIQFWCCKNWCCDVCDKQVQNMSIKQPSTLLVELWGLQSVLKVKPKSEVPCLVDVRQRRREEAHHCTGPRYSQWEAGSG